MMKKIYLLFILIFTTIYTSPSYNVDSLDIKADIQKDGSIIVTEKVVYDINNINGILYDIDTGEGSLKSLEILYTEDGRLKKAINSNSAKNGNFTVNLNNGVYKIKLYDRVKGMKKSYIFKYRLDKMIKVYRDVAQLNRKFVGKNWSKGIEDIYLEIKLPEKVDKSDIYAFGHGSSSGKIEIVIPNKIVYSMKKYKSGQFLEANVVFPKSIINSSEKVITVDENGLNKILKMENFLLSKGEKELYLFIGAIIWGLFLIVYIYIKNSKRYKVDSEGQTYFSKLPDDYSPAIVGTLLSKQEFPTERELLATILELVRKGVLQLSEEENRTKLIVKNRDVKLSYEESFVLRWYIDRLGDGKEVYLDVDRANREIYYKDYMEWREIVHSDMVSKNLTIDKRDRLSTTLGIITGFSYFIGGFFLASYFERPIFIALTFLGFFLLPYTNSRKRATREKENAIYRWKAFKNYLITSTNFKDEKELSRCITDQYFIYAIALRVADKVVENYKRFSFETGEREIGGLMRYYIYRDSFRNIEREMRGVTRGFERESRGSSFSESRGFSGGSSGGSGGSSGGGAF